MACKGTTVIVTGSAGGLGKDIAKAYLDAGANVTICDINPDRLSATEAEFTSSYPDRLLVLKSDVSDESSTQELVASTVAKFGKLDILVNNAGIMDVFDPVGSCSKETWDRVLAVNLTGPFLASKAAVNQFLKQGTETGGLIINIGSTSSYRGLLAGVAYTTSKHGVVALTKNTAGFYAGEGIYSVALLLGGMGTTNIQDAFAKGMNQEAFGKISVQMPAFTQITSGIETEQVGRYCVFLSDRGMAASANGSCIVFDRNRPAA
jgi:NAD(P)-dependent dehydrogenase (short-subunit alcohol dehydrogenase family)